MRFTLFILFIARLGKHATTTGNPGGKTAKLTFSINFQDERQFSSILLGLYFDSSV